MMKLRTYTFAATLALMLVAACTDSTATPEGQMLALSVSGLQPLASGFHYEGWAIIGTTPVSTGKFNVDAQGNIVTLTGAPVAGGVFRADRDLRGASAIVITIEPTGDTDALPTSTHYLGGAVVGGSATLTVGASQALGNDFNAATGKYVLATPTTATTTDEKSGLWFIDLSSGNPAAGLSLPTLPAGWKYEGWAVINGVPVSTGTFTAVNAADDRKLFSGPLAGPPFPGEDFIVAAPSGLTFPTNLAGGTAVVSIEPSPDDSPSPFTLKPLTGAIPAAAVDHVTYPMTAQTSGFPRGTAVIR